MTDVIRVQSVRLKIRQCTIHGGRVIISSYDYADGSMSQDGTV